VQGSRPPFVDAINLHLLLVNVVEQRGGLVALSGNVQDISTVAILQIVISVDLLQKHSNHFHVPVVRSKVQRCKTLIGGGVCPLF